MDNICHAFIFSRIVYRNFRPPPPYLALALGCCCRRFNCFQGTSHVKPNIKLCQQLQLTFNVVSSGPFLLFSRFGMFCFSVMSGLAFLKKKAIVMLLVCTYQWQGPWQTRGPGSWWMRPRTGWSGMKWSSDCHSAAAKWGRSTGRSRRAGCTRWCDYGPAGEKDMRIQMVDYRSRAFPLHSPAQLSIQNRPPCTL